MAKSAVYCTKFSVEKSYVNFIGGSERTAKQKKSFLYKHKKETDKFDFETAKVIAIVIQEDLRRVIRAA